MQLPRFFGFVDLGVLTVVLVFVVLPPREMFTTPAHKGDDAEQFALALAEARTMARPDDGAALDDLGRRLGEAKLKDWAIEATMRGAERAAASPSAWRARLAASVAYVDRLDVRPGLDQVNLAMDACHAPGAICPTWEEVRMKLYHQHLDAGVKSGIDPRRDPKGFRRAGEAALRTIHLGPRKESEIPVTPSDAGP